MQDIMVSVPTVDIEAILKPISADHPCGIDPRDSVSFETLKEARREEEELSQGDWKREVKSADWPKAIQIASKILSTEGKELQVAAWLAEGLVRKHGTAGLRDGLMILRKLHEQYWDSFYPLVEDGDLEFRSGRLEALNKVLPVAIMNMPLIYPPGGPGYTYWHYKQSQEVENLRRGAATDGEKKRQLAEALEDGKLEGEKFEKAVTATPVNHCSTILETLGQCSKEFEHLERILDERYGTDAPSLRSVKETIGECRVLMTSIVRKKGGIGIGAQMTSQTDIASREANMAAPAPQPVSSGSGIIPMDRADALRRLAAVAEFYRRTEPHSPVGPLVQRAARWGEMPLEELLQEVIKSEDVLGSLRETLGLNQNQQGNDKNI
jgi:type VI secretion system protein ImpA